MALSLHSRVPARTACRAGTPVLQSVIRRPYSWIFENGIDRIQVPVAR